MSISRPLFVLGILSALLAGCGANQAEMEALKRRVSTLEKRVRALEGGPAPASRGAKAKGKQKGKGKQKAPAGPPQPAAPPSEARGGVSVEGDAVKVFLKDARRRWPVPGVVPAGEYEVLASFGADDAAAAAGSATVKADTKTLLTCTAATSTCSSELLY